MNPPYCTNVLTTFFLPSFSFLVQFFDARCVFEAMLEKDVVSWNSIISGFVQSGEAYEALNLFRRMGLELFSPDAVTVVGILSACASLGMLHLGCSVHGLALKDGLVVSSIYVGTALLNFYAKCGDARAARMVFDSMGEKNTILAALASQHIPKQCE